MSYDDTEDNKGWADMLGFEFPLLSDPDRKIARMLDVKRSAPHPLAMFPRRVTYLIDPEGTITHTYDVGRNIKGHGDEVLEELRGLVEGR